MKKKKIWRYVALIVLVLILILNSGARTLVRRWFEQRRLNSDIESAQERNVMLKKRLSYLQNEPSYIERAVREELMVVAPGEVEYRFQK